MNRRELIVGLGAALRSSAASSNIQTQLARVSISSWSFHDLFPATRDQSSAPIATAGLDLMDFPEMIADKYKVHATEIVAPHFASTENTYLQDFKQRLQRARSRVVNIPVDITELEAGAGLSDKDELTRATAVSACKKWIDVASALGAQSVRCDPGKLDSSNLSPTISSYRTLASYAERRGVYVLIENHGGVGSEHPEELVDVFRGAGQHSGALPDFGNFADEQTRQRGLRILFPFAKTVCHVKDPKLGADWRGGAFDFGGCMNTSRRTGFSGFYSIEAEFGGNPYVSVRRLLDELVEHL